MAKRVVQRAPTPKVKEAEEGVVVVACVEASGSSMVDGLSEAVFSWSLVSVYLKVTVLFSPSARQAATKLGKSHKRGQKSEPARWADGCAATGSVCRREAKSPKQLSLVDGGISVRELNLT